MNNFIFYNPTKVLFGSDQIKYLGHQIRKYDIKKVLLIYGKDSIKKNGVYEQVTEALKAKKIQWVEVSGVQPNPVLSKVNEAIETAREHKVKGIVAVGGGSVIDTAKAVAAGFYWEGNTWDFFTGDKKIEKALPLFTVLTISATGSEMNGNAVITNEKENKKWDFGSVKVNPAVSIIDPSVQESLPVTQMVNGAVDAISHTLEYYFDGTKGNLLIDEISEGIIRTVIVSAEKLIENHSDYEARANLAWAASLALNGLTGSGKSGGDWSSHAIEHSLSAMYDIAHGAGLSIIFPAWMKYNYLLDVDKFERFAEKIFDIREGTKEEKAEKGIEQLKVLFKKWGAPVSLREAGIEDKDIIKIAENAEMLLPFGVLRKNKKEDIEEILNIAKY